MRVTSYNIPTSEFWMNEWKRKQKKKRRHNSSLYRNIFNKEQPFFSIYFTCLPHCKAHKLSVKFNKNLSSCVCMCMYVCSYAFLFDFIFILFCFTLITLTLSGHKNAFITRITRQNVCATHTIFFFFCFVCFVCLFCCFL